MKNEDFITEFKNGEKLPKTKIVTFCDIKILGKYGENTLCEIRGKYFLKLPNGKYVESNKRGMSYENSRTELNRLSKEKHTYSEDDYENLVRNHKHWVSVLLNKEYTEDELINIF